jgi:protein-S-isoprenylcysteine O-methyltransferase Ste14
MKQHSLDPISLVFGGLLAALGVFLVSSDARWESASGAWALPTLLVFVGGAVLWSTLRRLGESANNGEEQEYDEIEPEEYAIPDTPDL